MPKRKSTATPPVMPKTAGKTPQKEPQSLGRWALDWAKSLGAGFLLFLVVRAFILQTWVITSGSMEGTLLVGDLLVLNKVAYGAQLPGTDKRLPGYTDPKRGDIVVFRAHHDTLDVIKRIVGMPGDTLSMRDKVLFVNGHGQTEPYVVFRDPDGTDDGTHGWMKWQLEFLAGDSVKRSEYIPTRDNWGPIVVPADHYFMMGDNRDDSLDSRFWGFLDGKRIKGKAEVVYYSYNRDSMQPFSWITDVRWNRIGDLIR